MRGRLRQLGTISLGRAGIKREVERIRRSGGGASTIGTPGARVSPRPEHIGRAIRRAPLTIVGGSVVTRRHRSTGAAGRRPQRASHPGRFEVLR